MRRKRRETVRMKKKRRINRDVVSVAISCVCVAIAGVFLWANGKQPEISNDVPEEVAVQEEASASVETSQEEDAPVVVQISLTEELNPSEEQTVNPNGFVITSGEVKAVQPIQEEPKASVEVMDPPALEEGTDLTDPSKIPEYEERPKETEKPQDTVVTKQKKDESHPGQMYIEGLGWITIGNGNTAIYDSEMYMNGNKVGDM